ncbi:hypothetical protein [Clostridium sp. OS1-26]|nr:hypothetical protein [Clostridium sp. OS1-26]WML32647.1 hypothetical protein RCG18_14825 [Clostridium sp. OS1-26]
MDESKYLILLNGEDKTKDVLSYKTNGLMVDIEVLDYILTALKM